MKGRPELEVPASLRGGIAVGSPKKGMGEGRKEKKLKGRKDVPKKRKRLVGGRFLVWWAGSCRKKRGMSSTFRAK